MKNPGIFVRWAGTPLISCLIFAASALIVYGWYLGYVVWWVALAATLTTLRALSATQTLRRYKAWRAEWDAMGKMDGTPSTPAKRERWKLALFLAPVFFGIPILWNQPTLRANVALSNSLLWIWLAVVLYLLFKVFRRPFLYVSHRLTRRQQARLEAAADAIIELAVGRASGCPTRASAERNLPDYCLRLMRRE